MKFLSLFKRKQPNQVVNDEIAGAEIVPQTPRGGMHKTKHKQFTMDTDFHGGRIVKTMPRNLRQMKELSEKIDD